ncbi:DNA gyrase subunit A [Microcystis aeruginosa NIES-98]|nr:DNA gyrase subunit A [Microcystis aeruginosa NIES-98]
MLKKFFLEVGDSDSGFRIQETGDYFYLFSPFPHFPISPFPHFPTPHTPHPTPHTHEKLI